MSHLGHTYLLYVTYSRRQCKGFRHTNKPALLARVLHAHRVTIHAIAITLDGFSSGRQCLWTLYSLIYVTKMRSQLIIFNSNLKRKQVLNNRVTLISRLLSSSPGYFPRHASTTYYVLLLPCTMYCFYVLLLLCTMYYFYYVTVHPLYSDLEPTTTVYK